GLPPATPRAIRPATPRGTRSSPSAGGRPAMPPGIRPAILAASLNSAHLRAAALRIRSAAGAIWDPAVRRPPAARPAARIAWLTVWPISSRNIWARVRGSCCLWNTPHLPRVPPGVGRRLATAHTAIFPLPMGRHHQNLVYGRIHRHTADPSRSDSVATSATLHTSAGPIRLELFPDHAPKTVRNFVELAQGTREYIDPRTGRPGSGPYYDGTIAHRVIDGFMVQMGDPTGTGRGGPGYTFPDEFHPELTFDRPYLLAMANAVPGTNGSQFFITFAPTPHLNFRHTFFGQVADEESARVVDAIAAVPTDANDRPLQDVVLERVEIT